MLLQVFVNPTRSCRKNRDWPKLRKYFAWKPWEVIRDTFQVTTQYAVRESRLPLRRHFRSRFPALNVRRLDEDYATDTIFANTTAHDGSTCAQLFVGRKSMFTSVHGMKKESKFPSFLMDFIQSFGAMKGLFSDNAKSEISKAVTEILRQYHISDKHSEPYYQNQNPAERRIQEIKSMTNMTMDRVGAPPELWLLCMVYVVYILNRFAHATLNGQTPMYVGFGTTPDISALLLFYFYQRILYLDPGNSFPDSKEKCGRFVGIAENVGDALTFLVLTDDTHMVIGRSDVRPADDPLDPTSMLM